MKGRSLVLAVAISVGTLGLGLGPGCGWSDSSTTGDDGLRSPAPVAVDPVALAPEPISPPDDLPTVVLEPEIKSIEWSPPPYRAPYEGAEVMSGFWNCRRGRRRHYGLDLWGVGEDAGLGTRIHAIGNAVVTFIGRPEDDSRRFGSRLRRRGTTVRGHRRLPTHGVYNVYGRVYYFTRRRGSWRTGEILVTELLDGPYAGYTVRYMHLAAVHPDLAVGDIVKVGQEIGLLGGTAIQESSPHLHLDASDPDDNRVNLAPLLGIETEAKDDVPGC